jgi:hypothetical protein
MTSATGHEEKVDGLIAACRLGFEALAAAVTSMRDAGLPVKEILDSCSVRSS